MVPLLHYFLPSYYSLTPRNYCLQIARPSSGTHRLGVVQCSATKQASTTTSTPEIDRQSSYFKPSSWSYDFVQSLRDQYHTDEEIKDRAKKLKKYVKSLINNEENGFLTTLELVDDIQRLGLGYHFEEDIHRALHRCLSLFRDNETTETSSLHGAALSFRVFRQHGFEAPQEIFRSFTDENGCFKESISKDVKGLLSLYEASYLGFEGEELMDEAKAFARKHLKGLAEEYSTSSRLIFEHVNHALELPLHYRIVRLETRWYIETYSKRPDADQVLLEAAKLDFNLVQSIHKRDLKDVSRWWKGLALARKLSFSRDRLIESFFWALGMVHEPQYSNSRKEITKAFALVTVIDDVYDVYGTLDELELFTDIVERWDAVRAVNELPDYMKICFLALYNTVNEMAYEILKDNGQNVLVCLQKAWADLCKAFLVEAKWTKSKYAPTFEEYLENAWTSVSGIVLLASYFVVSEHITKKGLECFDKKDHILRWPCYIFRLTNDLATSTAEIERGETANSISCCMRQNPQTDQERARTYLRDMIDATWKKMNKEYSELHHDYGEHPLPHHLLETAENLARISECQYQYGDAHGDPDERAENRVLSLIINPIQ